MGASVGWRGGTSGGTLPLLGCSWLAGKPAWKRRARKLGRGWDCTAADASSQLLPPSVFSSRAAAPGRPARMVVRLGPLVGGMGRGGQGQMDCLVE